MAAGSERPPINAATLLRPEPTAGLTEQQLSTVLAVNVAAPVLLTCVIAPSMASREHGAVAPEFRPTG